MQCPECGETIEEGYFNDEIECPKIDCGWEGKLRDKK